MVVVDPANNTFGEVFTSSRIVEALGSLLNQAKPSSLASSQSSDRMLG